MSRGRGPSDGGDRRRRVLKLPCMKPAGRVKSPLGHSLYELVLRCNAWHHAEHACFFLTALAFWRPIILPWRARASGPRWAMIVCLTARRGAEHRAGRHPGVLGTRDLPGASDRGPRAALDDQALAGVIMWVPGSAALALALLWLVFQSLGAARFRRGWQREPGAYVVITGDRRYARHRGAASPR